MRKNKQPTNHPADRPKSVVVRKKQPSARFRKALTDAASPSAGRPPYKVNEIVRALGHEFNYFVDACCDRRVTTRSIMSALRSLGVVVSYQTMLNIRKQIESENRWFYDLVEDMEAKDDEGVQSES